MDTRFIIPVSVAVAVHALAFFYPKSSAEGRVTEPAEGKTYVTVNKPEERLPMPEEQKPEEAAALGTPDPGPRSEDTVRTPEPKDFVQTQQPPSPYSPNIKAKFEVGPPGVPDGVINGTLTTPTVFNSASLDRQPRTRVQVAPTYPVEAKSRGLTAEVVVGFIVDEQGRVTAEHVVRSSDPMFEEATLQAVRKWRFEPGKKDGRLVKFRLQVPVVFNLNE
ncbi:MAG: energy transducer TonB [Verrucomicrobia bacterium]|nr:energy transducer TonB [Verrucomicrobiota bacterium]